MLDLRTLSVATITCAFAFMVAMWLLKRLVPQDRAVRHWRMAATSLFLGLLMHGFRGKAPELITVVLGNTLVAMGGMWCMLGSTTLSDKRLHHAWPWWTGALCFWISLWLGTVEHPMYPRLLLLSAVLAVCFVGSAWGFWSVKQPRIRRVAQATALFFGLGAMLFLARMALADPQNLRTASAARVSWEFVLPYSFAILFFNWLAIVISVVVGVKIMEQLQAALRKVEESDRVKSTFLASISHEWRTPLNAISGFAQLMSRDGQIPEDARRSAGLIQSAGSQLLTVVNELLDLHQLQDGSMEFGFQLCHIQPLIDTALASQRESAKSADISLMAAGAATNPTIWVDPHRFTQVLSGLIGNAIKFNQPNGQVSVHWESDGYSVTLLVRDDGPGIPRHLHHRVFKAFDRLGAESGPVAGTGIGLAVCQQLIHRMGGQIGFSSDAGAGCEFWVQFPQAESVLGEVVLQQPPAPSATGRGDTLATQPNGDRVRLVPKGRLCVLYVEDNVTNQKLVQAVFQKQLGITVDVALTAEEGLEVARQIQPDLILMDINLPGMDGYQALKTLRLSERTCRIPVMAVTAQSQPGDRDRGAAAGFDAYITKPLNLGELTAAAKRLLKLN